MENEQPNIKEDHQPAPQQPGKDESYKQKWNYDDIPDLNRLKAASTPQAQQLSQKVKRQRRNGGGLVEQAPTTRLPRARRRPNETPPFLSIGNAANSEKNFAGEPKLRQPASSIPRGVNVPHNTPSRMSNNTPISGNARARSANRPRSINSSCWNNLIPKKYKNLSSIPDLSACENKWTKMPFKQSRTGQKDPVTQQPWSPAQTLKEKTTLATYHVARIMAKQTGQPEKAHKGKLVKARLQPLVPVHLQGPTIDQCQGIVSGTMGISEWTSDHVYDTKSTRKKKLSPPSLPLQEPYIWDDVANSSPHESRKLGGSRTLQRRRHIISMMSHEFLYERPQTGESIHCTSIASDLTENRDSELRSDIDQLEGSGTDSEHVINVTNINHLGSPLRHTSNPKPQTVPQAASLPPCQDQFMGGGSDDLVPGKSRDHPRDGDDNITVIPCANDGSPRQPMEDDSNSNPDKVEMASDVDGTEPGKHSELLKLVDGEGERPSDSVQYPKPGALQRKLAAIERPQSVPQKAVHFLDDEIKGEDRAVQRSKSAYSRITGRERPKTIEGSGSAKDGRAGSRRGRRRKPTPTECKAEGLDNEGSRRKDPDDEGGAGEGNDRVPTGSGKGVAPPQGGESSRNGGGTRTVASDNPGSQGKQQSLGRWAGASDDHGKHQSLGLQEAIIIRASGGEFHPRQGGQLIGDANNVLAVVSKNLLSSEKSQPRCSKTGDGKSENLSTSSKPPRKARAKTAGPTQCAARKTTDLKRPLRPHTAHNSSMTLDLEFTHDPKEEIVAHGDVCFVGPQPVVTRTKAASQMATKTKHPEKITHDEGRGGATMGGNIKVGVCSGCCKTSMLVGDGQQAMCCNCLLKVNTAKAEASDVHHQTEARQDLRKPGGKDGHFETIAELASNDSDYGSNSEENAFMTCFSDLEASLLLARQEIRAEMKEASTESDLCLVAVDEGRGDDSEADKGSEEELKKSIGEDTRDGVDEVLARCYEDCISVAGSVGEISEYLTNTECYKSMKTKQQCSENAVVHKVPANQPGQTNQPGQANQTVQAKQTVQANQMVQAKQTSQANQPSARTTGRSEAESLGKDVKSGDVSSYEVMLMKDYSTNVDIPSDDEDEESHDTPFLELMCRCLPEPTKAQETASPDRIPDLGQLSVKAQMKPLSKPRSQPSLQDPIAKYPPVCFRVNARPPDHHLYYFAYGMDMNPDRFSTYIKRDVDSRLWGLLFGFQLKFNKTGADADGGCFPNIEFNPYSSVEGCLYVITEDELLVLDKCVGFPENLERVVLPVWMLNCAEPDDLGIAQYCVAALTYVAKDQCTHQEGSTEMCSDYALDQCLRCSDLLTPAYREHLRGKKPSAVTTA